MSETVLETVIDLGNLRRQSVRATIVSGLGALVFISAFLLSLWRLNRMEKEVIAFSTTINESKSTIYALSLEKVKLQREVDRLHEDARIMKDRYKRSYKAYELLQGRKYLEAMAICDEILIDDPNEPTALALKAHALYRLGKNDESIAMARRAAGEESDYAMPLTVLCWAEFKTKKFTDAGQSLDTLLAQNPSNYSWVRIDKDFSQFQRIPEYQRVMGKYFGMLKSIQQGLITLHYYKGNVDGIIGPHSLEAIATLCAAESIESSSVRVPQLDELIKKRLSRELPLPFGIRATSTDVVARPNLRP